MRPVDSAEIYLCTTPIDFRKGIKSLAVMVEAELELNPFSEQLFLFTNRRRDRVKLLYWERTGFCLWMKLLEQARFIWPDPLGGDINLTAQQFQWLMDGYDLTRMKPHATLHYQSLL